MHLNSIADSAHIAHTSKHLQALCQKLYIIDNSLINEIILSIRTQMQLPSYS